jgi:hypothetical protein
MYIEGITVCVNYSDFLAHTLPQNKQHFNKLIVVTSNDDILTQKLCEYHHVQCIKTDAFYNNGDKFNKANGINEGLKGLSKKDWVIHFDSDIYLPPLTRNILENTDLNTDTLYGIDRMMCPSYEDWQRFVTSPNLTHEGWVYMHTDVFPMGVRIGEYMSRGYEPIGFFQMWNPIVSNVHSYPNQHGAADRTDVLFAKLFSRNKRALIPEIIAIHLDSENHTTHSMGKNWNGRKTAPFTIDGRFKFITPPVVTDGYTFDQSVLAKWVDKKKDL